MPCTISTSEPLLYSLQNFGCLQMIESPSIS
jgi:hypothetical protein